MRTPTRTPDGDAKFFAALESGHPVHAALAASGYSRTAVYHWRKRRPYFAAAWANARASAIDAREREAMRRAKGRA